ncbi:MAG: hypothetical protein K6G15_04160 [Desulfovibrio sp.]|nr:hypothetical protein [Desulfovibrio sp.]
MNDLLRHDITLGLYRQSQATLRLPVTPITTAFFLRIIPGFSEKSYKHTRELGINSGNPVSPQSHHGQIHQKSWRSGKLG